MGDPFKIDSSLADSFKAIEEAAADDRARHARGTSAGRHRVVVLGGGKGASLSIRTLLSLDLEVAAVVAMADDGGSTGIIRKEAHVSPPGDVRKCLGAMAADQEAPFTHAFRYRFEFARNHTLGNLILSALEHETGSFPEAVRICEGLLDARGHVYPSTLDNVRLAGVDVEGRLLSGQAECSRSPRPLERVWLEAPEGCRPYSRALEAIRMADAIVLGPGSLFTSVIPNLLVPGVVEALGASSARRIFVCNCSDLDGETGGMRADEHVEKLLEHGMRGLLDYAIVHSPGPGGRPAGAPSPSAGIRPVGFDPAGARRIEREGIRLVSGDLAGAERPEWHDPFALRGVFEEILGECLSPRR